MLKSSLNWIMISLKTFWQGDIIGYDFNLSSSVKECSVLEKNSVFQVSTPHHFFSVCHSGACQIIRIEIVKVVLEVASNVTFNTPKIIAIVRMLDKQLLDFAHLLLKINQLYWLDRLNLGLFSLFMEVLF